MKKVLIKYVRKVEPVMKGCLLIKTIKHAPYGCVVATGNGQVGWSLCSKEDKFDKKMAVNIAVGRAGGSESQVPKSLQKEVDEMLKRSKAYFK